MILKLLLIIGVISTVYFLFFKKKPTPGRREKETEEKSQAVSELVECTHCGVYIEIEETLLSGTKYYCSRECLNAKV